jgi:hypothetical protein
MSPTQRPSPKRYDPQWPTTEQLLEAVQDDDHSGFCLACGAQAYGVEPDARRYDGIEECLMRVPVRLRGTNGWLLMCG